MASLQKDIAENLQLTSIEPLKSENGTCEDGNLAYKTNVGNIFVKVCDGVNQKELLYGEFKALEVLEEAGEVKVPHAIKVFSTERGSILITEYIHFTGLHCFQAELGRQLASLHLRNIILLKENSEHAVKNFGFYTNVCCGRIPVDNQWNPDWLDFFLQQRLSPQVHMITSKTGNKELLRLWSSLKPKIAQLFDNITVLPSLLHGDLWSGNAGETESAPVIFDPASFYGHHEFDLAIAGMFGGFSKDFYREYHRIIPQETGFEKRILLYQLFHYLNHWNHFGSPYQGQSLKSMEKLLNLLN